MSCIVHVSAHTMCMYRFYGDVPVIMRDAAAVIFMLKVHLCNVIVR